jgi:hypothetical protein
VPRPCEPGELVLAPPSDWSTDSSLSELSLTDAESEAGDYFYCVLMTAAPGLVLMALSCCQCCCWATPDRCPCCKRDGKPHSACGDFLGVVFF